MADSRGSARPKDPAWRETASWRRRSRSAAHGDAHLRGELADAFVGELPEASLGFNQTPLADNRNVFGAGCGVCLNPVSPAGKKTCVGASL